MSLCIWIFRPVAEPLLCKSPTLTSHPPLLYFNCLHSSKFVSFPHSLMISTSMPILNPLLNELEWYQNCGHGEGPACAGGGMEEVGLLLEWAGISKWRHLTVNWRNKEMTRVQEGNGLPRERKLVGNTGQWPLETPTETGTGKKTYSRSYRAKRLSQCLVLCLEHRM